MTALTMTTLPKPTPQVLPELPVDAVSFDRIKTVVMKHYGIKLLMLIGPNRHTVATRPRMVAMWLGRRLTRMSYPEIGAALGGRDHSTVISGCRKIERLLATDAELFARVASILEALKHGTQLPLFGGDFDA
jgi:chromosomal replication initiator protein